MVEAEREAVRKGLQKLATGAGVRRLNLRTVLTPELCARWRIIGSHTPRQVKEIVVRELGDLIVQLNTKKQIVVAEVGYGLSSLLPEECVEHQEHRLVWLSKASARETGINPVGLSTARGILKEIIETRFVDLVLSQKAERPSEASRPPSVEVSGAATAAEQPADTPSSADTASALPETPQPPPVIPNSQGEPAPELEQYAAERGETTGTTQSTAEKLDLILPPNSAAVLQEVVEESPAPTPSPDLKPHHTRPRKALYALLAVVLLTATAITIITVASLPGGPSSQNPQSVTVQNTQPVTVQNALSITVLGITDGGSGWSVAFPANKPDAIKDFLGRADRNEPSAAFFGQSQDRSFLDDALNAGGYILGVASIQLELEGMADRQVTIYKIRITSVEPRAPLVSGAAIVFPAGAGSEEPNRMSFNLDVDHPVAKEEHYDGGANARPFFDVRGSIHIAPGNKETLLINARPLTQAHAFNIIIDYEVAGQKHSRVVTRSGQMDGPPFRVSASLCPKGKENLPAGQLDRLRNTAYGNIRSMRVVDGEHRFTTISQITYTEDCPF